MRLFVRSNHRRDYARGAHEVRAEGAFLGNPKLYAECFLRNRPAMSIDGRFPEGCVETAAKALASVKPELADFKFDAAAAYTNRFADAAKKA